jgi:alcohol-forming fatty acyl-CoA reductase
LNQWPNTYTFTKAIAEDVLKKHCHNIPVGMVRPGIVISTYQEPVSGWIDNFYGPTGVIAGAGTGVLRSLRCNPKMNANMVPVDLCVNSILTAAWDVARQYNTKISVEPDIPVYNFCTPVDNELTWGDFTEKTIKYGKFIPW